MSSRRNVSRNHRVMRSLTAAVLALAAAPLAPEAFPGDRPPLVEAQQEELVQALDSLGRHTVESGSAVGLGLGVYRDGEPVLSNGYGEADAENGVAATDSTVFRIGSVTKQFTAAAVLRLEEEGALSRDDELTDFLPEYPVRGREVTLHHLLTHTSGIPNYTDLERWQEKWSLELSHEEMLELFQEEPFDFEPGEEFAYSNSGYFLLGLVVEEASGMDYDAYLEETFFEPLELRDTRYCWHEPLIPRRARGYTRAGEEGDVRNAPYIDMGQPYAAGALCSSVRDLARWSEALHGGEVLSPDAYERMTTAVDMPEGARMEYGYGVVLSELQDARRIQHGGGIPGFNAQLAHYPAEDLTVVALANLNGPAADEVAEAAARLALGLEEPEVADEALSTEERRRYVGTYDLEVMEIEVFEEDGELVAQGEGQPSFPLLYQGDHEFRASFDTSVRLVFTVEEERAESVVLHQGGMEFEGPRTR